jgi:hypothetical protein
VPIGTPPRTDFLDYLQCIAAFVRRGPTPVLIHIEDSIHSLDPGRFPRLCRHIDAMANQSFILRWESGSSRPLNSAFDTYVEVAISGLRWILGGK